MKRKNQYILFIVLLALLLIVLVLWFYDKRLQKIQEKNPVNPVLMKRNLKSL